MGGPWSFQSRFPLICGVCRVLPSRSVRATAATRQASLFLSVFRIFPHCLICIVSARLVAQPSLDSLELHGLHLRVAEAEDRVHATDFLHRLIPRITFAASFGLRDLLFVDSSDRVPFVIPSDLYRLTVSLSLSDMLSSHEHEAAILEREKRLLDLRSARIRQSVEHRARGERERSLRGELALLEDELEVLSGIHRFQTILFEEGKIQYDALARSELQVIEARVKKHRLLFQLQESTR